MIEHAIVLKRLPRNLYIRLQVILIYSVVIAVYLGTSAYHWQNE